MPVVRGKHLLILGSTSVPCAIQFMSDVCHNYVAVIGRKNDVIPFKLGILLV